MRSDVSDAAVESGLAASRRYGVLIAGAAALCVAALIASGWLDAAQLLSAAKRIGGVTLTGVLLLSLLNYGLRALRWHLVSRQVAPGVTSAESLATYLAGFAFLLTPAKVGEVVRLWLLHRNHRVPYARSLSLMVIDRAADVVCLLGFAVLGLLSQTGHAAAVLGFAALMIAALGLAASRRFVVSVAALGHHATGRRWPALFVFALSAHRALLTVCRPRTLGLVLILNTIAWGAQVAGLWLLIRALSFDVDFAMCAFIFAMSVLVGAVPFFPGGVGGAEATMISLMMLAGLDGEAAVTATVLSRLATLWFALAIGLALAPVVLGAARRQIKAYAKAPHQA